VPAGGALEAAEDPLVVVRGDPRAAVLHLHDGRLPLAPDANRDRPARAVLDRVGQQVGEDLFQLQAVGVDDHGPPRLHPQARAGGLRPLPVARHRFAGQLGHLDGLDVEVDPAVQDPRDVEQVLDQALQALGLPLADLQVLEHGPGQLPELPGGVAQELDGQLQREEGVFQFVRGDREELVPGLQRLAELGLGLLLRGHVEEGQGGEGGGPVGGRDRAGEHAEDDLPLGGVPGDLAPGGPPGAVAEVAGEPAGFDPTAALVGGEGPRGGRVEGEGPRGGVGADDPSGAGLHQQVRGGVGVQQHPLAGVRGGKARGGLR
jgi:hypothetical protein